MLSVKGSICLILLKRRNYSLICCYTGQFFIIAHPPIGIGHEDARILY
jgi:hypothetical protein